MAKTNYNYEKRARELEKQKKKEDKLKKRQAKNNGENVDEEEVLSDSTTAQES